MENNGPENSRTYAVTSIQAGIALDNPALKPLDMSKLQLKSASDLPEEIYQRFVGAQESFLEGRHSQPADTSKNPTYKEYATVRVNGKVVAEIDNHGWVKSSNALGGKIHQLFSDETNGLNGPSLAQERAEKIAAVLGGTVERSSTALTQAQFNSTSQPKSSVDYQAMREDPAYQQLQKTMEARTLFLAQQMAQESVQKEPSAEKFTFDTNRGENSLDLDTYYNPKGFTGRFDLDKIPLLLPSARNIEALSGHASVKFQELLKSYGIPEGPEQITYDNFGQIEIPDNYPHTEALKQALKENPDLDRELRDIAALTSHYAGIQDAMQGGGANRTNSVIALIFGADGKLSVIVDGEPYGAAEDHTQIAASSDEGEGAQSAASDSDAVNAFLDYMSKTPEERYYEALLAQEGLTKEQLAALPPDERAKIEAIIQEKIKQHLENKTAGVA